MNNVVTGVQTCALPISPKPQNPSSFKLLEEFNEYNIHKNESRNLAKGINNYFVDQQKAPPDHVAHSLWKVVGGGTQEEGGVAGCPESHHAREPKRDEQKQREESHSDLFLTPFKKLPTWCTTPVGGDGLRWLLPLERKRCKLPGPRNGPASDVGRWCFSQ
jgi:hypothetical protein